MKRTSEAINKAPARADSKPAAILTIKINLIHGMYAKGPWEAVLEIDSSTMLEDLHFMIQSAVGFDDDHSYMFYIARTERSRDRTVLEHDEGVVLETTVAELFPLPKHRKLFYWFDFGDDWKFSIARVGTAQEIPVKRRKYPRLVSTRGRRPVQYPSWD